MASNRLTGAEALVRMLQMHGVEYIFGLCGDTSLPFYDALAHLDHGIRHVLTRDERSAAYMADAYARVSGKVGICEGPSGGGATYILPGLVEANESSIPILAITTDISVASRGHFALTELDQTTLFRPVTKWSRVLDHSAEVPSAVRTAFSRMTTGRPGSAHLAVPYDVQLGPVDERDLWAHHDLGRFPARRVGPSPDSIRSAAEILVSAKTPLFICGGGVVIAGAEAELVALAECIGAPVATSISGQGSISEDHPLAVGVVGSNGGTTATRAVVDEADVVVFIGCRAGSVTTERWRHPVPGDSTIVHIDCDPAVFDANYPTDVAMLGDAKLVLNNLVAVVGRLVEGRPPKGWGSDTVARARKQKFEGFRELAASDAVPIRPERIISELETVLDDDAIVLADPGTPCPYVSAYYRIRRPGRHFISNRAHGALGYAIPAAVGAHFGRPGAKCVAISGDGSFGFCAGELETLVRLDLPITIIVISNSGFGWIKAGQKTGYKERYFSVDFNQTDHAAVAKAYGLRSWRVEDPAALKGALAAACEADGPTLVDIVTQPLQEARAPVSEWVA